jgi:hypothetical protein
MNPFKQAFDAAIDRGEDEYTAKCCAKILYADHVHMLYDKAYSNEFIIEKLNEYSRQLAEVI